MEERNQPSCAEWVDTEIQWVCVIKRQLAGTRGPCNTLIMKNEHTMYVHVYRRGSQITNQNPQELVSLTHLVIIYYLMVKNAQKCMQLG